MPRLSLYNPQKSNNYKYIDRIVKEQYVVGGTDLLIHKYIGVPADATGNTDIDPTSPLSQIQDLLFLETRDRRYEAHVYRIRGHYQVQNLDFDLSQFGLFLNNDTVFITVHYNDMIDLIGRKIMVSDVLELPHLTDYHPLNDKLPIGLRRYYQVTDANFASEGYSSTWYPHLWRIKCEPLVDTQLFSDILNQPLNKDNYMGHYDPTISYVPGYTVTYGGKVYTPIDTVPVGVYPPDPKYWEEDTESETAAGAVSTYNQNLAINDAVIAEARRNVPKSGYDTSNLYVVPTFLDNHPSNPVDMVLPAGGPVLGVGSLVVYRSPEYKNPGYAIRINHDATYSRRIGVRVILGTGLVRDLPSCTGSGRVTPDVVLVATVGAAAVGAGPYGTADNTYATADQYPIFKVVSTAVAPNSDTVKVQTWSDDIVTGLVVRSSRYNTNGTLIQSWPDGTTITSINKTALTFTTSNPSITGIISGDIIDVAADFSGSISSAMNYRADCDPRFQYIRRASPRSFGYINGYLTGDGTAPNGEPAGSGDTFPGDPKVGDYFLRTDYIPQRMFRFSGRRWTEISRNVRTTLGVGATSETQLSGFINESGRTADATGGTVPTRQTLSTALRIKPD